ncbi:hypothetical protein [Tardiphaga robiniae]|uniref:hypothetical protein n=1 Tax=Tardiphaga robiniae TaxID=943830 RepID=UPI001586A18C|nr:hypothetical protein [Tardiphaga robiniae]NUU41410.1 hypothetical protein [Tardiphaga robiniae]
MAARAATIERPRLSAREALLIDAAGQRVACGLISIADEDFPPAVTLDGDVYLFVAAEGHRLTYRHVRVFHAGSSFR